MFQQFVLLKDLPQDQIDDVLAQNDLYRNLNKYDIASLAYLPEINLNNNFVNICKFVDYYQLIPIHEFLENIRFHIMNKNKEVINDITKLPLNMQQKIYDHECIPNMKCEYHDFHIDNNIKHISCYKFFSQKNMFDIVYTINDASRVGSLELVKYLFKLKKYCTRDAIDWASQNGHLDVVKYLFEVQNKKCSIDAIGRASQNGHLDVVKYLFGVQNQDCTIYAINLASMNGHLDIVKYLFEIAHKDCNNDAMDQASQYGHLEVVKYLFEVQHKDCTTEAIDWASRNGHLEIIKYLFEVANKDCTQKAIDLASHFNQLKIVRYLIEVQNKTYTQKTIDMATMRVEVYLRSKPNSFIK